ncbi:MAG: hypothetical protein K0R67_1978 [Paenibacillus sp.]|jgi:hypothetical protein|nr:hypothetical protein [Paenibacillus sp.]
MPNIWTHYIFGEQLLDTVLPNAITQEKTALRNLFRMGCQGPDLLFYHHFLPWQSSRGMPAIGSAMHSQLCGPVLLDFIQHASGKPLNDPVVLYVLGFLTHHILDRNMHPYVFYKSGFRKWDHQRFEIGMDSVIVKRKLGLETWKTPVWKQLDAGPRLPDSVTKLLVEVTAARYPELTAGITEQDWQDAYRDMLSAQKLFHDPTGLKRLLTGGYIRKLVFERNLPDFDILNEDRNVWHHPAIPEETYTDSIWDMWEQALEDGKRVLQAAVDYISTQDSILREQSWKELVPTIGNVSYETGRPCDSGLEIHFVRSVYE